VAYGLGNWFLPQRFFYGGELSYPEVSKLQLALEWSPAMVEPRVHWFEYEIESHALRHLESEGMSNSSRIRRMTPFQGFDHEEYVSFFRANREKRTLLPIYRSVNHRRTNMWRDRWIEWRAQLIDSLVRSGLKSNER
jgi:hypothetical protein